VRFYRDAALSAKKMDLKYRETLPATVRDVAITVSDDEPAPRSKKRKSRKKTIGKNGLYPEEEEFVRKWWKGRSGAENGLLMETSREAEAKKHIGELRLRETQLQILLILETIALESADAGEEKTRTENDERTPDNTAKKPKTKKPQDLNVLLELHLDRLCIWHAVSAEETTVPDTVKTHDNHLSGKKVESDAVRDFCTEVIVPFYASRLPDKCKLITRKFGVNGASSPRAKQSRSQKAPRAQPGPASKREQPQKSRRTLQRVLTDEQSTSQARPSLPRSNTTPANPDAKRESMDPLLPMLNSSVRGGIQKAKRVENREVDLNAAARQHESKLKKVQVLVDQKKELDAAIHALRKPNRELVAKDIAEDADKRTSGGSSRKQKNPVRNPMGQGVQVMATPKGPRKKDVGELPPLPKDFVRAAADQSTSPSRSGGSTGFVPGSAVRPRSFPAFPVPDSDANHGDNGAIQETPSRHPAQQVPAGVVEQSPLGVSGNLFRVPSRPAPRSTDVAPSTPVSARRATMSHFKPGPAKSSMVMETPPKNPRPDTAGSGPVSTPAKRPVPESVPVTPEKSIYEQLRWDDDELG
jgi:DNA replication regulator SLD3